MRERDGWSGVNGIKGYQVSKPLSSPFYYCEDLFEHQQCSESSVGHLKVSLFPENCCSLYDNWLPKFFWGLKFIMLKEMSVFLLHNTHAFITLSNKSKSLSLRLRMNVNVWPIGFRFHKALLLKKNPMFLCFSVPTGYELHLMFWVFYFGPKGQRDALTKI